MAGRGSARPAGPDVSTVLCVASAGGHLQQLQRIVRAARRHSGGSWVLVTTRPACGDAGPFDRSETCTDFSRDNPARIVRCLIQQWSLITRHAPASVITTGAAPGLVAVACARLRRIPALWIDSLANSRRLSLSGRIARRIGVTVVSQWPEVARQSGVTYTGRVL